MTRAHRSAKPARRNKSLPAVPRRGIARRATSAARLRASLSHPVIDADGHVIETAPVFMPFFEEYVTKIAGADMVKRFRADAVRYQSLRGEGFAPIPERPQEGRGILLAAVPGEGERSLSKSPTCQQLSASQQNAKAIEPSGGHRN